MGSIYWRGDVAWAQYYVKGQKKPVRVSLKTKNAEVAQTKLGELLKQRDAIKYDAENGVEDTPWSAFKKPYLKQRGQKKSNTERQDKVAFDSLEAQGPVGTLQDLTAARLEQLVVRMRDVQKLSPSSVNRRRRSIIHALSYAVERGMLSRKWFESQNWSIVEKLREPKGKKDFFEREEVAKVSKKFRGIWRRVLRLAHRVGLRAGEIHHAKPDWYSDTRKVLRVQMVKCDCPCRDCIEHGKRWVPKDYEEREIPVPDDLAEDLAAIPSSQPWMIMDEEGYRPRLPILQKVASNYIRRAGLKGGGLHTFRHTCITEWLEAGVPPHVAQKWAGHADLDTMEGYAHVTKSMMSFRNASGPPPY